jgi:hypothetical protein
LCSFLQPALTSSLFRSNIPLSTLFSNNLNPAFVTLTKEQLILMELFPHSHKIDQWFVKTPQKVPNVSEVLVFRSGQQ